MYGRGGYSQGYRQPPQRHYGHHHHHHHPRAYPTHRQAGYVQGVHVRGRQQQYGAPHHHHHHHHQLPQPSSVRPGGEAPPMPFGEPKQRCVAEHCRRCSHRPYCPPDLVRVTAHWADVEVGAAPFVDSYHTMVQDEDSPLPPAPEQAASGVDIRVLPVLGCRRAEAEKKHIAKCWEVVVCSSSVEQVPGVRTLSKLQAYGGRVEGDTEAEWTRNAAELVKAQSGLDLTGTTDSWMKFVELAYAGKDGAEGRRVIFYVPPTTEDLRLQPQFRQDTVEVEVEEPCEAEEVAEQEEEEVMEPKGKPQMRKVKKTEIRRAQLTAATRITVGSVLATNISDRTAAETVDMALAVDGLDEMLQREYAQRIHDFLAGGPERVKESAVDEAAVKEHQSECDGRIAEKRKRLEEVERDRKRVRLDEEQQLRDEWRQEDDGLTDDEKRAEARRRFQEYGNMHQFFVAHFKETDAEHRSQTAEIHSEIREIDVERSRVQMSVDMDASALEAFQYFDRTTQLASRGTGQMSRLRLEGLLLSVPKPMTRRQADALIAGASTHMRKFVSVPYAQICSVPRKRVREPRVKEEEVAAAEGADVGAS